MGAFIPKWRPLDAVNSARLLSARPDEGGVVALCVSPSLAGTTEAAALAIELAGTWAGAGLRILLADGTVGTPSLHIPFGLPNDGGLADVLLAGAGWEPLTLPTGTPGMRLLPAGGGSGSTAPRDALDQLARLCAATAAEGTLLVFFVPLGSMVTEWVFGECRDIVVLSTEGENLQPYFDQDEDRIRALLGRHARTQVPAGSADPPRVTAPVEPAASLEPAPPVEVESAEPPRPPRPKRTPSSEESRPGAPSARSERRAPPLPGSPPPTERIEEAWARAAAQLRATLDTNPQAMDDLFSTAPPPASAPPPAQASPKRPEPEPQPEPEPEPEPRRTAAPVVPPGRRPVARAAAPSEPATGPRPDALPLLEPLPESPPASKPAGQRSRANAAEGVTRSAPPAAPPSSSKRSRPPPSAWKPAEIAPVEEPRKPFADPDLPPPLPLLESWDPEFDADEAHDRARGARWRRRGLNGLLALAGVALVATAVVVYNAGKRMPPLDAPVSTFPRAVVESGAPDVAPGSSEAGAPGDETPGTPPQATREEAPQAGPDVGAQPPVEAAESEATPASAQAPVEASPRPTVEAAAPPPVGTAARPSAVAPGGSPSGATPSALAPSTPHQRFSWSIAALAEFQKARDLAQRLGRAVPDQLFMVAPIVSNGRTLYRVLGGASDNRPSLTAQRSTLGERTGMNPGEWFVRDAPSAYLLDEFADAPAAEARVQALWSAGIPAYVLGVDRRDGSAGFRVYAGAYANEEEAAPLLAMLREAGITGMAFTERRGRVGR